MLTTLEERVLRALLFGESEELEILRQQLKLAQVSSREMTGVGFYTDFIVASGAPRLAGFPSFELRDVEGTASNVEHGFGFLLFVDNGCLAMLEGFTFDEPWPKEIEALSLRYSGGQERDMQEIRKVVRGRSK